MLYSCKIKIKPKYEILSARAVRVGRGKREEGRGRTGESLGDELASGDPSLHMGELLCHTQRPK